MIQRLLIQSVNFLAIVTCRMARVCFHSAEAASILTSEIFGSAIRFPRSPRWQSAGANRLLRSDGRHW